MKHLLIIFNLLLTLVSWSKDVDYNDLVKRDGLYYEKFSNDPFTGKVTGRMQGNYKDGKREGEHLGYFENGQLSYKGNYKDGKKEGEHLYYYESIGQLWSKINYKDGKYEGKQLWYSMDGKLEATYIYKDGKVIKTINH